MSRFVQAADSAYGAAIAAPFCAGTQPEYNVCLDEQYGEPSVVFAAKLTTLSTGLERVLDIAEDGTICPSCCSVSDHTSEERSAFYRARRLLEMEPNPYTLCPHCGATHHEDESHQCKGGEA